MEYSVYQMIPAHRKYLAEYLPSEYFDATIKGEIEGSMFIAHYERVCTIEASDLDEVFHIGNVGPEHKITREAGVRMSSVSVGDVIGDNEGRLFIVKPFGFDSFNEHKACA
jgi:hypothetical protein